MLNTDEAKFCENVPAWLILGEKDLEGPII